MGLSLPTDRVTCTCFDFGLLKRSKEKRVDPKHTDCFTRPGGGRCRLERARDRDPSHGAGIREASALLLIPWGWLLTGLSLGDSHLQRSFWAPLEAGLLACVSGLLRGRRGCSRERSSIPAAGGKAQAAAGRVTGGRVVLVAEPGSVLSRGTRSMSSTGFSQPVSCPFNDCGNTSDGLA